MRGVAQNDRKRKTGQFRGPRGQLAESIVRAAQGEFMSRGFKGTSIESIAKAARIAKGTVYLYFDTKEEVFRAVSKTFISWMLSRAARAAALQGTVEERLAAVLDAKFGTIHALASQSPHGAEIIDSSHGVSGDLYRKADREYVKIVASVLEGTAAAPGQAAWLVFRAAEGSERADASTKEVRRRLSELAHVLVRGLRA
jgi:AcrR family transcriptional regulator